MSKNQTAVVGDERKSGGIVFKAFAVALAAPAAAASAAIINYAPPTLVGTDVNYVAVSESSGTSTPPLYGTPTVSGDDLSFRNMSFSATSVGGSPATVFVDGQINATIQSDAGKFIKTLSLSEFGDYNVSATPANPVAVDFVKVYPQALQITVLAINNVPLATPLVDNTSAVMTLSPSGGDFQTGVDPSTGSWTGSALANLTTLFGSSQITEVSVSFNNQLLAQSQVGGIASISKKGFDINPSTVPEPTSTFMVGSVVGLGGLVTRRRRNRAV